MVLFSFFRCGDLSADHDDEEENEYRQNLMRGLAQNNSQLSMIFNTLGSPSDEDIAALDPNTANILRQAPYRPAIVGSLFLIADTPYLTFLFDLGFGENLASFFQY
jgi:hypothetical protein